MAKLIYTAIASLDGYIEDAAGEFDWAMPDEEVHRFVNDLERPMGTYLYGRRMYETMVFWESVGPDADAPGFVKDYAALWQAADKVVYSRTLEAASSARTRILSDFDADAVAALKESSERDISIGGPGLAAAAFEAGLVDEVRMVLVPVSIGGGKPAIPLGVRVDLDLLEERRFGTGMVYLRYRVRRGHACAFWSASLGRCFER